MAGGDSCEGERPVTAATEQGNPFERMGPSPAVSSRDQYIDEAIRLLGSGNWKVGTALYKISKEIKDDRKTINLLAVLLCLMFMFNTLCFIWLLAGRH
jgi:hypothetical protein